MRSLDERCESPMFWCVAGGSREGGRGSAASSGVGAGYGRRGVRAVLGRVAVLEQVEAGSSEGLRGLSCALFDGCSGTACR